MSTTAAIDLEGDFFLLSNLAPSAPQKRLALAVVKAWLVTFVIAVGLPAHLRPTAAAFVPADATALLLAAMITAVP